MAAFHGFLAPQKQNGNITTNTHAEEEAGRDKNFTTGKTRLDGQPGGGTWRGREGPREGAMPAIRLPIPTPRPAALRGAERGRRGDSTHH